MTTQTFNDGFCHIYSVTNKAEPGNKPVNSLEVKESLRYDERTVGISRYWQAMQNDAKVDRVLRMPRRETVSNQDICIPNDGFQYKILQVQYPKDPKPQCMDLSLQRLTTNYKMKEG